jgi:hypothetical protein
MLAALFWAYLAVLAVAEPVREQAGPNIAFVVQDRTACPPGTACTNFEAALADKRVREVVVLGDVRVGDGPPPSAPTLVSRDVLVRPPDGQDPALPPAIDFSFAQDRAMLGSGNTLTFRGLMLKNMRCGD